MKPLSAFCCLSLRTASKLVCKSFLMLVTLTMTINTIKLDYEGPRKESIVALALVMLFIILLTGAAFTGHSGADRESLCLVTTSLGLMVVAILLWIGLGTVSMQKGDPQAIWHVCLENRCTETFWTLDFSYRNSTSLSKNALRKEDKISTKKNNFDIVVQDRNKFANASQIEEMQTHLLRNELNYPDEDEGHLPERTGTSKPITLWKRFTGRENDAQEIDRSTGISLLLTLIFFLLGFVYFFTCVTIICSYSAELYEEYTSCGAEDEEDGSNSMSME